MVIATGSHYFDIRKSIRTFPVFLVSIIAITVWSSQVVAREGMFTPDQLPGIGENLRATGLKLDPTGFADITAFPLAAVISLGGCSASFVSPKGLVITNHHCARGSVQFQSSKENNYLENGFLAASMADEIPAAPGSRVYVTVQVDDVTGQITDGLDPAIPPRELYALIEQRQKALIQDCETDPGYRCRVNSFFGGLQYRLVKRLEIRDVRIVYSPADAIGKYGGDIDNWRWPRHTGDFAFYRAYVSADGLPADHSMENVPYEPEHYLNVSGAGLDDGDFVMAMGYPGSTSRYARLARVTHTFNWEYPRFTEIISGRLAVIEDAAPQGTDAGIRYASRLAGLNNVLKNLLGQIEGARRQHMVERRAEREAALDRWIAADTDRASLGEAIKRLDELAQESADERRRTLWYDQAKNSQLLNTAQRLYRLARERQKPDAEREPGYQERDMTFIRQRLNLLNRRYDASVDKAEWTYTLGGYLAQAETMRFAVLDKALGLNSDSDKSAILRVLDRYYADTVLENKETRLAMMSWTPAELEESKDPFMRLAVILFDTDIKLEEAQKSRAGLANLLRPQYMQAIINWQASTGHSAYPDANSTLRITYGTVMGGSPMDGLIYEPFTRLEGILQKDTGDAPFNAPATQLELIRAGNYGGYKLESIGSVPVNFLSDLDSTGGNSGSATLNDKGELVGLLFDGTLESVNSDWDFDPHITRTIHVDTRYMLWVMEMLDGADALIREMTIVH